MRFTAISGIGPIAAPTFEASVDEPGRFTSSRTVAPRLGLTPRRYQSGEMPSGYQVVRGVRCDENLELIFDHLFNTCQELGDRPEISLDRTAKRPGGLQDDLERLGDVPFQDTLESQIMDRLRHVTKGRAAFYFTIDKTNETVRVLGVFFGAQDHSRYILGRTASDQLRGTNNPVGEFPMVGELIRFDRILQTGRLAGRDSGRFIVALSTKRLGQRLQRS